MQNIDAERRSFLKWCLLGIGSFFVNFSGLGRVLKAVAVREDQIGLLYSTATGIVLRTINPDRHDQPHLDWLEKNKPEGTSLLRLNKSDIGADDKNCPNLDFLIPYVSKRGGPLLSFGKSCMIVDENNKFINHVIACPVLYQKYLNESKLPYKIIMTDHKKELFYLPQQDLFIAPKELPPIIVPIRPGEF